MFIENTTPTREPAEHGALTIEVLWAEGTCVVHLGGDLDLDSVPILERELAPLIATRTGTLVVDLKGLRFIDSAGLRCLFETASAAEARGDAVRFQRATGHVEEMLQLTDIKRQLRFVG